MASGSFDEDIEKDNVLSVSKVSFGKILIDGNQSRIETQVTIDNDQPTTLPIDTRLVKENEQWKVDYRATMDAVKTPGQMTQLLNRLKTFSEKLSEEFGNSIEQFDQAMPEIEQQLGEMEEQIREKVPELKERFDELAEEIRKALQESLQAPRNDDNTEDDPVDEDSYSI